MKRGGVGGAKTQQAGAKFEESTAQDFLEDFNKTGFAVVEEHRKSQGSQTLHGLSLKNPAGKQIEIYYQDGIYKLLFEPNGIDWKKHYTSRLRPDTAIYSPERRILTIIEKKQQETTGSVAEKLQTCDYKLQFYKTLARPLNIEVELVWLLGPYFKKNEMSLKSVFKYMEDKGSRYYFSKIPLSELNF
jgi:hypothetical protein